MMGRRDEKLDVIDGLMRFAFWPLDLLWLCRVRWVRFALAFPATVLAFPTLMLAMPVMLVMAVWESTEDR